MSIKINRPSTPKQVVQKAESEKDLPVPAKGVPDEVMAMADETPQPPADAAPVADPVPSPKTSPSPCLGDVVIYRTQEKSRQFNGSSDHVAIISRVWEKCVNLKVLPDCGAPYDATSQSRIAYQNTGGQGWFTVGEAKG